MTRAPLSLIRELDTMRERLDRLFADLGGWPVAWPWEPTERLAMPLDVQETDNAIVVKASMPGVKPEDVQVEVKDGYLSIRGETKEEKVEEKGTYHLRERRYGAFQRTISLPSPVDESKAEAKLVNGVLELTLPKAEAAPRHRIPIKTG